MSDAATLEAEVKEYKEQVQFYSMNTMLQVPTNPPPSWKLSSKA